MVPGWVKPLILQRFFEIITISYFRIWHKNRREYNQPFELLFPMIKLHFGTSNELLYLISIVYLVFSSLKIQGRLYRPKYTTSYFILSEKSSGSQTLKSSNCKKVFLQVQHILLRQLASINVFISMWWLEEHFLYKSVSLLWGSFQPPLFCSL